MAHSIKIPISDADILSLDVGDSVLISGTMITGRDAAHKWLMDTFIKPNTSPSSEDKNIYQSLLPILNRGVIYHCGPVVSGLQNMDYRFIAAGPTTSIREEPYQADVMRHFNLRGVIGKGGMGDGTLKACGEVPAVYFHAIGGAAALAAACVKQVKHVYKLDLGVPEAIWVIEVLDFPVVVTMDAHGNSLHEEVRKKSKAVLNRLLAN